MAPESGEPTTFESGMAERNSALNRAREDCGNQYVR